MKVIHTVLWTLAFCLVGCSPTEKENPKGTSEDNLEAILDGPVPEDPVDVNTHIRIENQTRSTIAIKFGSTAEKIAPGAIVFIPEEYENENGFVSVRIAQEKEGEWKIVYASKWHISEERIESYVMNETTSGKFTIFGTRDRVGESDANEGQSLDVVPRRRVIIENEEPIQSERDNG